MTPTDHLSALKLEQLALGELTPGEARAAREHLAGCARCATAESERAAAELALFAHPVDPAVQRIHAAVGGRVPPEVERLFTGRIERPWWQRGAWLGAFLGATAAAMVVMVTRRQATQPAPLDGDVVRVKGGLGLTVYRERGGEVTTLLPGDTATEGDQLKFGLRAPAAGFVAVLGREASGATYVALPASGESIAVRPTDTELPGAARLDGSVGDELLVVLWCPEGFQGAALAAQEMRGSDELGWRPAVPPGCVTESFPLKKVAAP